MHFISICCQFTSSQIITDCKFLRSDCCEMSLAVHFPVHNWPCPRLPELGHLVIWLILLLPSQQNCIRSSIFKNTWGICVPHHQYPLLCKNWVYITAGKKKKKSRKDKNGSQSYFNDVGWTVTFTIRSKPQISLGSAEIRDETEDSSGLGTPITAELFLAWPYLIRTSLHCKVQTVLQ